MEQLPSCKVFLHKDARTIDEAAVRRLMESIREVGLINPIRVRETTRPDHPQAWEVIAGAHRLRAMKKLGFEEISAVVVNDDDLHAELAMIDENLMRAELSPADRAAQTVRRKAIYLQLHPETAADQNASRERKTSDNLSFVSSTSDVTGKDKRTIERDAERGEKISEEILAKVRGTVLDKGTELDKLKKVAPENQGAWVEKRLAEKAKGETPKRQKKAKAKDSLSHQMFRLWLRADAAERAAFSLMVKEWEAVEDAI